MYGCESAAEHVGEVSGALRHSRRVRSAVRRPDPADRRARRVVATQLGTELLATLNDRLRAAEASVLAPLDLEVRETFRAQVRLLATRADALDPLDNPCALGQEVDAELPSSRSPAHSARMR